MAGSIKLQAGTHTQAQDGTSAALANNAAVACATAAVANQANLDRELNAVLSTGFGSAPAAGAEIQLYLVPKLDGTNLAAVDTSTPYLPPNCYAGSFFATNAATAAQRLTLEGISVGPFPYTAYLWNKSAQQMSAGWTLDFYGAADQYS